MTSPQRSWLYDMDGVLIAEGQVVEGADRFPELLREAGSPFLVLTNNSLLSPREISPSLAALVLEAVERQLWTSALATANFVHSQRPGRTAFVIGEASMHEARRRGRPWVHVAVLTST